MKKFTTKSNVEVFIIGDIIAYGREHVFPIEKLRLLSIYLISKKLFNFMMKI